MQAPFRLLGAKFGSDRQTLRILDGVSGCLRPVRASAFCHPTEYVHTNMPSAACTSNKRNPCF